jgi:hypothetical protein
VSPSIPTHVAVSNAGTPRLARLTSGFPSLARLASDKRIHNGKIACTKTRKRKEEKSAKSKRSRRVLWERLDLLLLERKQLARLPAYLLYLFSPLERNRDKHQRDVRKSNLDVGRPHEVRAQEVNNMMACHTDNLGQKLIHESITEKILGCLR